MQGETFTFVNSWLHGKNQEDEANHREVINNDGIYDIRVTDVLPKQVLTGVTEF